MPSLTGDHKVAHFGPLDIFAENGLIHVIDNADKGRYRSVSIRSMLHRAKALNDMLKNKNAEHDRKDEFTMQRDRYQRTVESVLEVCNQAQMQGDPGDPEVWRDVANRRPHSVTVPSLAGIL